MKAQDTSGKGSAAAQLQGIFSKPDGQNCLKAMTTLNAGTMKKPSSSSVRDAIGSYIAFLKDHGEEIRNPLA